MFLQIFATIPIMDWLAILSIAGGAIVGALLRYVFIFFLNPLFPTLPPGTLLVNVIGGFLMGIFIVITEEKALLPANVRLAISTGFLASFTTFSTFSAETVKLFAHQEYYWSTLIILGHLGGSVLATMLGILTTKYFTTIA